VAIAGDTGAREDLEPCRRRCYASEKQTLAKASSQFDDPL